MFSLVVSIIAIVTSIIGMGYVISSAIKYQLWCHEIDVQSILRKGRMLTPHQVAFEYYKLRKGNMSPEKARRVLNRLVNKEYIVGVEMQDDTVYYGYAATIPSRLQRTYDDARKMGSLS